MPGDRRLFRGHRRDLDQLLAARVPLLDQLHEGEPGPVDRRDQNYALTITSVRDSDESYANVATQLVIVAPLYKLDVVAGTDAATNNAWGTKDYSYYYENLNGLDRWRTARIEYCRLSGSCKSAYHTISIVY